MNQKKTIKIERIPLGPLFENTLYLIAGNFEGEKFLAF